MRGSTAGRGYRAAALSLLLTLAGCNKVKPGWSIEAPPQQYASGPTQVPGTSELRVTPEQANFLCHLAGVWKTEPTGFPVACFNPRTNQVILPDQWPSGSELDQMRAHEWAHARGWRHNDDGSGTSLASLPPASARLAQQLSPQPTPTPQAQALAQALITPPVSARPGS
jgi:hypothetical protein